MKELTTNPTLFNDNDPKVIFYKKAITYYLQQNSHKLTKPQCEQFLSLCVVHNLNPLLREVYAISYGGQLNIVTAYQVYLKKVEATGLLDGYEIDIIKGQDGTIERANMEIWRKDRSKSIKLSLSFDEWAQKDKSGQLTSMWKSKSEFMFRKTILSIGLREAFPQTLGTMPYTNEELWYSNAENERIISENIKQSEAIGTQEEAEAILMEVENAIKSSPDTW